MKTDTHPDNFRAVIFKDNASGVTFLISSTVKTTETGKWTDGKEYPLFAVEISSASHPFYTGKDQTLDTAGRVERFNKRRAATGPKKTKK